MGYVFVSYSRKESAAADLIIDWLERSGIAVWRDTASMPAGVSWKRQVADAIRGADLVVMCVSTLWNGSKACRDEEDWARYYHRPQARVPVDAARFDLTRAAAVIGAAWAAVSPTDRLAAELETAAGDWANHGSRSRDLARGRALRSYRRVFGTRGDRIDGSRDNRPAHPLTPVAVRYLRQSARHRAIIRVFAVLATVALVCAGLSGVTFATRMRQIQRTDAEWATDSWQWDELRAALQDDPYKAMETVLDDPHDEATMRGTMYVTKMRTVLGIHVPDDHGDATAPRFAAYALDGKLDTTVPGALAGTGMPSAKARGYAASPDGLTVAALADDGIRILDAARSGTMMTLVGVDLTKVVSMAWDNDGSTLAVRSSDGTATVWKVRRRAIIVRNTGSWFMDGTALGGVTGGPSGAGTHAVLLARDGRLTVVDTANGRIVSSATRVPLDVGVAIAAAPDATDSVYVSGTQDGATALYRITWDSDDLSAGGNTTQIAVPDGCAPTPVAVLPGGGQVALACGSQIDIIDTDDGDPDRAIVDKSGATVTAARADAQGRLFVGFDGGALAVVEAGADSFTYPGAASSDAGGLGYCLGGTARAVAVSGSKALFVGDGTTAQACSRDLSRSEEGDGGAGGVTKALRDDGPWTMHMGMTDLAGLSGSYQSRAAAAAPDGSAFAAGLSDGSVMFSRYDMQPGSVVREVPGEVRAVVYASDGSHVVAATRDGVIFTVDAPDSGEYEGDALRQQVQERLDRSRKLGLAE